MIVRLSRLPHAHAHANEGVPHIFGLASISAFCGVRRRDRTGLTQAKCRTPMVGILLQLGADAIQHTDRCDACYVNRFLSLRWRPGPRNRGQLPDAVLPGLLRFSKIGQGEGHRGS